MAATSTSSSSSSNALRKRSAAQGPLPSGPSSFPRRLPVQQEVKHSSTSSSISSSAQINNSQQPTLADGMARRLTRFYTANFERRPVITLCVTNCILSTFGDACAQMIPILGAAAGTQIPAWDIDRTLRFAMFGFSLGPLIEKWNRFLEHRFPLRPLPSVFHQAPSFMEDPNSPAFVSKLKQEAEKEGFRVNIDRGDFLQGQNYASNGKEKNGKKKTVDPQTVAMPNTGNPGQISVAALFKRVAVDQLVMAPLGLIIFISTMSVLEGLEWEEIKERYRRLYWSLLIINWQIWPFVQLVNFRYIPLRFRVPFSASLGVLWTIFLSFKNASATNASAVTKS